MPNFAALEQRLNRVATTHLANATAVWFAHGLGGQATSGLRVVFDREAAPGLEGLVNDANPVLSVYAPSMPGAARGDMVEVTPDATGQAQYFQVVRALPDGAGLLVLHLVSEGTL
jgi:hypothetical protein